MKLFTLALLVAAFSLFTAAYESKASAWKRLPLWVGGAISLGIAFLLMDDAEGFLKYMFYVGMGLYLVYVVIIQPMGELNKRQIKILETISDIDSRIERLENSVHKLARSENR